MINDYNVNKSIFLFMYVYVYVYINKKIDNLYYLITKLIGIINK